jgi:hypothetical protein
LGRRTSTQAGVRRRGCQVGRGERWATNKQAAAVLRLMVKWVGGLG